jgi:hypothetical protein
LEKEEMLKLSKGDTEFRGPILLSGNNLDYATLKKNYDNKVMFAVKLGYSESLLQRALNKLGLNAEENQILEELIKLQVLTDF